MKILVVCTLFLGLSSAYEYDEQTKRSSTCTCGWRNEGRIIGGKETKKNEYPWIVAVEKYSNGYQYCGGSIITPRHVLTAAHCTAKRTASAIRIEVGRHNLVWYKEQYSVIYYIQRIIVHPWYDKDKVVNDISILETTKEILYNKFVGPVCLPNKQVALEHQFIKVMGWGLTTNWGYASDVLREVDLKVVPLSDCAKSWENLQTNGTQLCTYSNKQDSCSGDSGGPLVWVDPDTNRYTQVALVSYGDDYCGGEQPSVNTDLTAYLDWINSQVAASQLGVEICTKG